MIQKAMNWCTWRLYQQETRQRWRVWDDRGGGKNATARIEQFKLLSRPSFNPVPLNDPLFQQAHYQAILPAQKGKVHQEYVYHVRTPCYIEPEFGYVIMEPDVLIPESLSWSHSARIPHLMHFFSGVPSTRTYQDARQGRSSVRQEQIVISLRHVFDSNYGHCLIQLMTTLFLLDECGVSPEIPVVVSSQLGRTAFFQELIQCGKLRKRRWIVQGTEYIHAQELVFASAEWPTRRRLNQFLDAIEVPPGDLEGQRRLFILRRSRHLSNMDTLLPTLDEFGFERIRPEELTFAHQRALFAQAAVICGAVGAGLTNVIFRRDAPAEILELEAASEHDTFFYGLAKTCGYSNRHLIGSDYETRDRYSNFSVNPEHFRQFLIDAVANL